MPADGFQFLRALGHDHIVWWDGPEDIIGMTGPLLPWIGKVVDQPMTFMVDDDGREVKP
ncbi:hypothetical protein [Microbacterium sp.]|uniref:hypothetical protein n=1 Tax=Microbacterium sp. TaxID=51671 RepID=UPI002E32CC6F|nr:hypothetical protein [Microbacterium sp.]HEX5728475.1 hypothetical protein [Microbacterium sp.]